MAKVPRDQKNPPTLPRRQVLKPGTHVTTIALPTALWEAVKIQAIQEHIAFRDLCEAALRNYLAEAGVK